MYRYRLDWIEYAWAPALVAFVVTAHYIPKWGSVLGAVLLGIGVIGLCEVPWFRHFGRYGDFSYGIYVYGFPVQQLVGHFTHTRSALTMFLLACPIAVACGALSWHLLEAKCIKLKRLVQSSDYPLSERHRRRVAGLQRA